MPHTVNEKKIEDCAGEDGDKQAAKGEAARLLSVNKKLASAFYDQLGTETNLRMSYSGTSKFNNVTCI